MTTATQEKYTINKENNLVTITLNRAFDASVAAEIRSELDSLTQQVDSDFLIDMSKSQFIDSSGVGAIVFLYKRLCCAGQKLRLNGVQSQPLELFKLLKIDEIINIE